jgi:hypothetical protein
LSIIIVYLAGFIQGGCGGGGGERIGINEERENFEY